MSKVTKEDIQDALEEFAAELGLDYSTCREEIDGGTINTSLLPEVKDNVTTEVTKEVKEVPNDYRVGDFVYRWGEARKEATLLGKVNALAEYLGVEFQVSPEKVTAEKVTVVKKATPKKSKVTVKKGKK